MDALLLDLNLLNAIWLNFDSSYEYSVLLILMVQ